MIEGPKEFWPTNHLPPPDLPLVGRSWTAKLTGRRLATCNHKNDDRCRWGEECLNSLLLCLNGCLDIMVDIMFYDLIGYTNWTWMFLRLDLCVCTFFEHLFLIRCIISVYVYIYMYVHTYIFIDMIYIMCIYIFFLACSIFMGRGLIVERSHVFNPMILCRLDVERMVS